MTVTALDRLEADVTDEVGVTRAHQLDLLADLMERRAARPYRCVTCIESFREPFCPACGLHLTLDKEGAQ